ncbi:hypothetical protein GGR50DRAFT_693367 [Xylaria sp. CBS 124048]|nr:hypothetical protein GGR50DRAFT_693367 [Xylaria sp. CBS 124048]
MKCEVCGAEFMKTGIGKHLKTTKHQKAVAASDGGEDNQSPSSDGGEDNQPPGSDGEEDNQPPGSDGGEDNQPPGLDGGEDSMLPGSDGGEDNQPPGFDGGEDSMLPGSDGGEDNQPPGSDGGEDNQSPGFDGGEDSMLLGSDGGEDNQSPGFDGGEDSMLPGSDEGEDNQSPGSDGGEDSMLLGSDGGEDNQLPGFDGGEDSMLPGSDGDDTRLSSSHTDIEVEDQILFEASTVDIIMSSPSPEFGPGHDDESTSSSPLEDLGDVTPPSWMDSSTVSSDASTIPARMEGNNNVVVPQSLQTHYHEFLDICNHHLGPLGSVYKKELLRLGGINECSQHTPTYEKLGLEPPKLYPADECWVVRPKDDMKYLLELVGAYNREKNRVIVQKLATTSSLEEEDGNIATVIQQLSSPSHQQCQSVYDLEGWPVYLKMQLPPALQHLKLHNTEPPVTSNITPKSTFVDLHTMGTMG